MFHHPLSFLWQFGLSLFLLLPLWLFLLNLRSELSEFYCYILLVLTHLLVLLQVRWIIPFCLHIRKFRSLSKGRLILYYSPERTERWSLSCFLDRCEKEVEILRTVYGHSLRGKVKIYLFEATNDVRKVFGPKYGCIALPQFNLIVIAGGWLLESMRHELSHLIAARWSQTAPPLFQEGLAMWFQGSNGGQFPDDLAKLILYGAKFKLKQLLASRFFFHPNNSPLTYVLAGSFTNFLIRRYGWKTYRSFYRLCDSMFLHSQFKLRFGVSMEHAERQWRRELLGCST